MKKAKELARCKKEISLLQKETKENKKELDALYVKVISLSRYFDEDYYNEMYSYPKEKMSAAEHYYKKGYKKGYNPSTKFDTNLYLKNNQDVSELGLNPLIHYEMNGKEEGRPVQVNPIYDGDYRAYKKWRLFKRKIGRFFCYPLIKKNKDCKILVVLHLFYMNSFEEIKEYLKNLDCYSYDLVVTYMEGYYDEKTLKDIKEYKKDAKLIMCKNRGYDIGPFLEVIRHTDLEKYDIVLKIQSKSTNKNMYIYKQFFALRDWFVNLFEGVLGSFTVHKMINVLYNENNYGLVAAKNLLSHDPKHKQHFIEEKMEKLSFPVPSDYTFVIGSCFAIRSSLLQDVKNLNIKLSDFEATKRGFFSFAHAMERTVCFTVLNQGYSYYGTNVGFKKKLKWHRLEKYLESYSALNVLKKTNFVFADDFVWLTLENAYISDYEVVKLPLKSIKRKYFNGDLISLKDCEPYKFLCGNKKIYNQYSKFHKEEGLPNMTVKRFEKLIKNIKKGGYNKKNIIVVTNNNIILDGQHRACIMLYEKGENYKIEVLRITLLLPDFTNLKAFQKKVPFVKRYED